VEEDAYSGSKRKQTKPKKQVVVIEKKQEYKPRLRK